MLLGRCGQGRVCGFECAVLECQVECVLGKIVVGRLDACRRSSTTVAVIVGKVCRSVEWPDRAKVTE